MFVALKLQDGKIWPNRFCRPDVQARWMAPVYTVNADRSKLPEHIRAYIRITVLASAVGAVNIPRISILQEHLRKE